MTPSDVERVARRVVELLAHEGVGPADFFTAETLAKRWAISKRTVRLMMSRGVIPSYSVNGTARRIKRTDVEAYERACREDRVK